MIIIIIIKIKRPNGEAPEISRRPKAGQQGGFGGAAPPRHHHSLQPKISAKRSSLSAGQRPASRGGAGGAAPPRPKLLHSPPANEFQAASRGCGGQRPPPNVITFSAGQRISGGQQGVRGGSAPPLPPSITTTKTTTTKFLYQPTFQSSYVKLPPLIMIIAITILSLGPPTRRPSFAVSPSLQRAHSCSEPILAAGPAFICRLATCCLRLATYGIPF